MTEADLERLVVRAARRQALQSALRWGLAALGWGALAAGGGVGLCRVYGVAAEAAPWLAALPLLTAFGVAGVVFWWRRPSATRTALLVDARANTGEALTTWLHLRTNVPTDAVRGQFRELQCRSALAAAGRIDLRRALPWHWPAWTRAVGLAGVILVCALLMPARELVEETAAAAAQGASPLEVRVKQGRGGEGAQNAAPQVEVFSPTEMQYLQLVATDAQMPADVKRQLLKELLGKAESVPEAELAAEVREILNQLRAEGAAREARKKDATTPADGAVQHAGAGGEQPAGTVEYRGVAQPAPERALAAMATNFSDVQDKLERYYRAVSR